MATLSEILDRDYQIANNISADKNVHATPSCIKSFKEKYMSFLSNFPKESQLRKDAILEIKSAMQSKHSNNESVFTPSGQIDNTKFNEIKTVSCAKLQNKYKNIDFSNLSNVSEQYQQLYASESQENKQVIEHNTVDFNNPAEKKAYFDNLYEEYSNLETFEEKIQYFSENFYDISNLTKEEQKQELNAYEIGNANKQIYDKIQEDNPEVSDEDLMKLYDEALEKKSEETGYSIDYLKKCDDFTVKLEIWKSMPDGPEKDTFFKEKITPLRETLNISSDQQEDIMNSIKFKNEEVEKDFDLSELDDEKSEIDSVLPGLEEEESEIDSLLPGLEDDELEEDSILPGLEEENLEIDSIFPDFENEELVEDLPNTLQPGDIPIPENKEFNSFGIDKEDLVEQPNNIIGKELAVIPQKNRISEFLNSIIAKIKNSKLFNNLLNRQTNKSQNEINLKPENFENAGVPNSLDYLSENAPSYEEQQSAAKIWKEQEKKKLTEQKSSSAIEVNADDSLTI